MWFANTETTGVLLFLPFCLLKLKNLVSSLHICIFFHFSTCTLFRFHLIHKSCIFQSLEITPSSYCHHVLPSEQVWFGYDAVMFPQQKQCCLPALCLCTPLLLQHCCQNVLIQQMTQASFSLGSFASKLDTCGYCPFFCKCIPNCSYCSLCDYIAVPWKALEGHTGVAAISRQGSLQGSKQEQKPGRMKSWRTQFIFSTNWITVLLN